MKAKTKVKWMVLPVALILALLCACGGKQNVQENTAEPPESVSDEMNAEEQAENETEEIVMAEQSMNPNLATRVADREDHYIFQLREDVTREKVYYKTRFGIEIAADL